MEKLKIKTHAFVYPMPMTLVGAVVEGKPNFMPVGWVSRVNFKPPLIAMGMGNSHYTNVGIHANEQFSVNVPSVEMLEAVDYMGLVTGKKVDKSEVFELFYGELEYAPMVKACPVTMACKLVQAMELPTNTLFIGEIIEAYTEAQYLTNGKPDIKKIKPFTLTMPDNRYWTVGDYVGPAWRSGKDFEA